MILRHGPFQTLYILNFTSKKERKQFLEFIVFKMLIMQEQLHNNAFEQQFSSSKPSSKHKDSCECYKELPPQGCSYSTLKLRFMYNPRIVLKECGFVGGTSNSTHNIGHCMRSGIVLSS